MTNQIILWFVLVMCLVKALALLFIVAYKEDYPRMVSYTRGEDVSLIVFSFALAFCALKALGFI